MSCVKASLEDKIRELANDTGFTEGFLIYMWTCMCREAAEDGMEPDWEQFRSIAMEHDF